MSTIRQINLVLIITLLILLMIRCVHINQARAEGQDHLPHLLRGHPAVVDGDTIALNGERVRLRGIDAPEMDQTCDVGRCGVLAREHLIKLIGGMDVTCVAGQHDRYGRWLAVCSTLTTRDLNERMVRDGWAVAYVRYETTYAMQQVEAKRLGRGMWAGKFTMPWDWRHLR